MTIKVYWRLDPTAEPDRAEPSARPRTLVRDVRTASINRYDHYAQIARAAALTHFDGLFVGYDADADDSLIIAAAVARTTPDLLLVPEFPASVGSAVYAAKQAVSFQRNAHQRLGWAIVPDLDATQRARLADPVPDDVLIERAEEFLTVARGVHGQHPYDFKGRHFEVQGGGFIAPLNRVAFPPVFLRGESEEALSLSAAHADIHLFEPAPLDELRGRIEQLDRLALAKGRQVEFGIVAEIAVRELEEDVPRLPASAVAGTYDTAADQLAELAAVGVTHFVLSGSPSFEEAYRVGQFVLPRLRQRAPSLRAAA
ncbi:MAG: LLM class flavin-dependent oxidoreductase [Novosphingobium sp.]|jgi:alkanesulfonate monooxygenase